MDLITLTDKICFYIKDGHYDLAQKRFDDLKTVCKKSSADEIKSAMAIIDQAAESVSRSFKEVSDILNIK